MSPNILRAVFGIWGGGKGGHEMVLCKCDMTLIPFKYRLV